MVGVGQLRCTYLLLQSNTSIRFYTPGATPTHATLLPSILPTNDLCVAGLTPLP